MVAPRFVWPGLVFAAVVVAACGGGSGDRPATPTTTPAASTATATPAFDALGLPVRPEAPPLTTVTSRGAVKLTWWGQAMFVLTSLREQVVVMDPYSDIGYRLPNFSEIGAGFVTVSHEHPDHNNTGLAGDVRQLRPYTDDGWVETQDVVRDVRFRTVPSWHDDNQGADRGRNTIFVFEAGGMRIVHLGDLGHALTQEQIRAIGPVDVLLVPVGGHFTIDAKGATEVVAQLAPRIVIPMHYKTKDANIPQLNPVHPFLAGKQVEEKGSSVTLDVDMLPPPGSAVVWLLEPAGGS